jgi:ubiquinone/menaquinone biosynthesis C-methylase UbiE
VNSLPPPPPDPATQKAAIVESWNSVAVRWEEWAPLVDAWFAPATARMMAALELREGQSVLELAAGSGGFTRYLAEAVGPRGRVVATDSGTEMVRLALRNATRAGWTQVEARVMDGEAPDVPPSTFDAIGCRQGMMFFADPAAALGRLRATLRPNGRTVVSVFSTPDRNAVVAMPIEVMSRHIASPTGPRPSGAGPGPFSLGETGHLEEMFRAAGFTELRSERVSCPLRLRSASEVVRFFREIVLGKLEELPAQDRERAVRELTERAEPFADPAGPGGPCELLVVSGHRSS